MSFLKKILFFINVLIACCLVAAGISIYINPEQFWIIAFFGLLFPYLLLVTIFFLFFWLIARFRYALLSAVAIIITLPVTCSYFAFHLPFPQHIAPDRSIKVMSYNVRNFNLYNWNNESKTLDKLVALISKEKPDIACFQEFFNADSGSFRTINRLMNEAGFHYYSFAKTVTRNHYGSWGVATFSRYPIINHHEIRFDNSEFNSSLLTDIMVDSAIISVFNAHLQSVYLSKQDYEYIEHVSTDQDVQVKPTRQIASKFKHAFLGRAPQALKMRDHIAGSHHPVIVCGDFNDTPASFCYHTMAAGLQDAFLTSGYGIAPTYSGFFSAYRIDYILCDKKFVASNYKTLCEQYSDHYAVECNLLLPPKQPKPVKN